VGVGLDCLLLNIAHKTVAEFGADEVGHEQEVEEDTEEEEEEEEGGGEVLGFTTILLRLLLLLPPPPLRYRFHPLTPVSPIRPDGMAWMGS